MTRAELTAWEWAVGLAVMFGDDTLEMTAGQAQGLTERIERAFLALPVEQRMEAMGMTKLNGSWTSQDQWIEVAP